MHIIGTGNMARYLSTALHVIVSCRSCGPCCATTVSAVLHQFCMCQTHKSFGSNAHDNQTALKLVARSAGQAPQSLNCNPAATCQHSPRSKMQIGDRNGMLSCRGNAMQMRGTPACPAEPALNTRAHMFALSQAVHDLDLRKSIA